MAERVLITGASGFVGGHVADEMARAGYRVRRALRRPAAGPPDSDDVVLGDFDGQTDWSAALAGVEVVVHAAAKVHVMDRSASRVPDAYGVANVDATRQLAESAARAGVRRFVFLSSASVNGDGSDGLPVSEQSPILPIGDYAASKARAESLLVEIGRDNGMQTVALRPPMVYGPGNPGNLPRLMDLIRRGLPLPFGAVDNRRSFIAVRNLTDAIVQVCRTGRALAHAYSVSDGTAFSTPQLIRLLAEGIGRSPRLLHVPVPWLMLLGSAIGRRDDMQRLIGSFEIDDSAFRRDLGWQPPAAPAPELVATGRWFAGRG